MSADHEGDHLEYEVRPDDVMLLGRRAVMESTSDVAAFIRGDGDTIASFSEPDYDWETAGWTVGPADRTNAEGRLYALASLVPPFAWMEDPRFEMWQRLLEDLSTEDDVEWPVATRDLWDLMLAVVRAERFTSGTIASRSTALRRVADEIRRRLLDGRAANG